MAIVLQLLEELPVSRCRERRLIEGRLGWQGWAQDRGHSVIGWRSFVRDSALEGPRLRHSDPKTDPVLSLGCSHARMHLALCQLTHSAHLLINVVRGVVEGVIAEVGP